jgi:hypothetical protein
MPSYRSSGSFGKRQEYIAVAEMLKRGLDVYMTLVDDQQIDCVVRMEVDDHPIYIEVQIKARSDSAKQPGTFAALTIRNPRPNFMFLFYSEAADTYWVMPSLDLIQEATTNKAGKNAANARSCSRALVQTALLGRVHALSVGRTTGRRSKPWRQSWRQCRWPMLTSLGLGVASVLEATSGRPKPDTSFAGVGNLFSPP